MLPHHPHRGFVVRQLLALHHEGRTRSARKSWTFTAITTGLRGGVPILDHEVLFSLGEVWDGFRSPLEGASPSGSRSSLWGEQVISYARLGGPANQARIPGVSRSSAPPCHLAGAMTKGRPPPGAEADGPVGKGRIRTEKRRRASSCPGGSPRPRQAVSPAQRPSRRRPSHHRR